MLWAEAKVLATDNAWRSRFAQADELRRRALCLDKFSGQTAPSKAVTCARAAKFKEPCPGRSQALPRPAWPIESIEGVIGLPFDVRVAKGQPRLGSRALRVASRWQEEEPTTLSIRVARPGPGQGAKGCSQPPSGGEIRGRAGRPAPGQGAEVDLDPVGNSDGESSFEEGAATASSKRRRSGGGTRSAGKRPRGAGRAGPVVPTRSGHPERQALLETINGVEKASNLALETALIDVSKVLTQEMPSTKRAIYNMAGASA